MTQEIWYTICFAFMALVSIIITYISIIKQSKWKYDREPFQIFVIGMIVTLIYMLFGAIEFGSTLPQSPKVQVNIVK